MLKLIHWTGEPRQPPPRNWGSSGKTRNQLSASHGHTTDFKKFPLRLHSHFNIDAVQVMFWNPHPESWSTMPTWVLTPESPPEHSLSWTGPCAHSDQDKLPSLFLLSRVRPTGATHFLRQSEPLICLNAFPLPSALLEYTQQRWTECSHRLHA